MNKAQASVELLIILAVSMVAIGLILILSNNEITNINTAKANSEAQNTVNKIAGTAEEVYISGVGSSKQIFVSIPSGVDASKTSVGNKTIRLNVNGTDLIAETKVKVSGSIPTTVGGHWIWITSYPGYVFIGDIQVTTDKGSIYSTIAQDTSAIESITVINNTSGNVQVSVSLDWTETEVTLSVSDNSFNIASESNYSIDLNFTSSSTAVGNYIGELIFDVNTVDGNKQIIVPLTLEVIVSDTSQPLMIFPDLWSLSINSGYSDSNTFQVCNTTSTALTNIVFTSSNGDAGDWVQPITTIASLAGNTCEQITVTIDVPSGSLSNTGTVTASDGTSSDFISLNVTVSNMTDNFNFSWSTAYFSSNSRLSDWTIENTSSNSPITIARVIVWDWNEADSDNASLNQIWFNGASYWNGAANAGDWVDITDFVIGTSTSYSAGNELMFNGRINNEGEYFRITFEFSDSSTYTTDTYYSTDVSPPIIMLESPANGFSSSSFSVQFDFSVNDADSDIAFCELIIDGAVDQTDSTITEGVTQSFNKTFASNGTYYWDVNCTDDYIAPNKGSSDENRSIIINVSVGPTVIAFHTFPDTSWSSGTGWLAAWNNSGDSSITSSGTPRSSNHLQLRRATGYAERAVDLSSYINPRLEVWIKLDSVEESETALILVSSDHSNWTTIHTFTSADSDDTYHFYEFDLNAFTLSSEFWIAFDAEMSQPNDYYYIDDVNIVQRIP